MGAGGCATEGGGFEQGPFVSPELDPERHASALIGPDGGSVEVSGADGTEYRLTIPADALIEETEIALTPVVRIDDIPMSGGLVAGVHFEPSGLELLKAATLTVSLPSAPSLDDSALLTGFVYDGEGDNLALALPDADGGSFTLSIRHFSGGGAGAATPSDLQTAFAPGTADAFLAEILAANGAGDRSAIESGLRSWYQARVRPALQAAVSNDTALERALSEHGRWQDALAMLGVNPGELLSESHDLAAAALRDAISRANDICERQSSLVDAEKVILWQRRAALHLTEAVLFAHNLDLQSVLADLCLQIVFESTSFPSAHVVGVPALLQVVVGFAFGNGPTELSTNMRVDVRATGASPTAASEVTDFSGRVELTLTPDSPSVDVRVKACMGIGGFAGPLVGRFVCQEAFIVRGLVIEPGNTDLAPGEAIAFAALLGGDPAAVSWSATGGTIDANGNYNAGSAEGTFRVTATSVNDPSLTATVTVRIGSNQDFDFRQFNGRWFGDLLNANGESVCDGRGPEGFEDRCIRFDFRANTPDFANLEVCRVSNQFGACGGTVSLWSGGSISGNVYTAREHRTTTFGSNTRISEHPCPATVTLETSEDGTQRLVGQLKTLLSNSCGPDSTSSFTMVDVARGE